MRRAVNIYVMITIFFFGVFAALDGWAWVRAYGQSVIVVTVFGLLAIGVGWLAKKLGIRIND